MFVFSKYSLLINSNDITIMKKMNTDHGNTSVLC